MQYEFKGWMAWALIIGLFVSGISLGRMTTKAPTTCSLSQ